MTDWVFGYGSLVWRPAFPYLERRPAAIHGWLRRFWQASTDHRGTPEAPGRVVTLTEEPGAVTWGTAYALDPAQRERILAELDHREKDGYLRLHLPLDFGDGPGDISALVYVAGPDNLNYLGPASVSAMAEQVGGAVGPSGANVEYVVRLAEALRAMGRPDPHVEAIEARLEATGEAKDG